MKLFTHAARLPLEIRTGSPGLDIVVPFTTRPLTCAALTAAGRLSADLLPLIRMVHLQVVPFPLNLDAAPVSSTILKQQLSPIAEKFGAHLQLCVARDLREALLQLLRPDTVTVIAARKHWWKSREERLARWLQRNGRKVVLEFVDKNYA